ncbi:MULTISPECIES: trypsin-like peptidase domain-containing protein [Paenibacillus]|uniref:Serine protease n=1 Tax=Paenibacillus polymyxa (strain SC2) TaxID=886882 RepID=E3EC09_PAEPS|nr:MULTISPECIES: trypsin-like peptidase domain-containing protein [Paenibacillus]MCV9950278.1 trypsin-like peptidase domain-containing protein [Paenibacillus sp. BT-177]ADO59349.1 serine protease [Paenibacillus polymyxa SC2]AJE51688.1 serine protease [Paenibacillus polymyxa]AZH27356.1 PDZ domain-containing protein [Paenibacillus sp. M-152]KAF6563444.1 trypsin-like peptidase domain-containing protein [Paenibacillus sp. EKM202P]
MGLFEDDFYSTKVSTRAAKKTAFKARRGGRGRWPHRNRRVSPVQAAVISGAVSAVVAVLLFSFITGLPSTTAVTGASHYPLRQAAGDPYDRIVQAAAKIRPAVVSIVNLKGEDGNSTEQSALGSGVIFRVSSGKAFIMTNNHVIEGSDDLDIVTVDGVRKEAKLVGKDRISDIAVLAVDDKGISTVADIGDSSKLRLGETVIAIGNPLGLGDTLTSGIVSYTNRIIPISINQDGVYDWEQHVIQTDAAINEGNSGGALVDLDGRVIGINTMKIADTGVEGLGFAIPANEVMKTVNELVEDGKITRPYLGVYTVDLNNEYAPLDETQRKELKLPDSVKDGAVVLEAHGPAKEGGLKLNDVITAFDGEPINSTLDLRRYLYDNKKIGDELKVTFYRAGKEESVTLKLTDKPEG